MAEIFFSFFFALISSIYHKIGWSQRSALINEANIEISVTYYLKY